MTQPALAFGIRKLGRHYPWPPQPIDRLPVNQWGSVNPENIPDGLTPLPSVTNILGIIDKPALLGWASEEALSEYRDCSDCGSHKPPKGCGKSCTCAPWQHDVAYHKWASNRTRDSRADAGTRAHTLAERLTTDQPLPSSVSDEDAAFADAFMQFWADHDPYPIFVEATVANPKCGYAGTADLFADIDGKTVVLDYKTRGEPPKKKKRSVLYDENRAQLAALANAYWRYEFKDGKWRSFSAPWVDEGWGVVLYPDGTYDTEVLDADELARCFDGFKGCIQTWTWLKGAAA